MPSNDKTASPQQHVGSTAELGDAAEKRRLRNLRRRVANARDFPENTCPASRHLHLMASALATGKNYPMLTEEPTHCAETMLAVLEALWKARTELARLKSPNAEAMRHAAKDER